MGSSSVLRVVVLALALSCAAASPALARALATDDVAGVLAVAYSDTWEADLASQGAEWVSTNATLRTLMGLPSSRNGSAIHIYTATLADGRTLPINMASARMASLPPAGDNVPVQGVVTASGTLILDTVSHYCDAPRRSFLRPSSPYLCSIGSDADLAFESDALAAAEASARAGVAFDTHLASHHLPSILDTLGLRPDSRRRAQLGAANEDSIPQFPADETTGIRKVLLFRVTYSAATYFSNNIPVSLASTNTAASTLAELHGKRSFGSTTLDVDVAPCVFRLPETDIYYYVRPPSDSYKAAMEVLNNGDGFNCAPYGLGTIFDHYVMVHPYSDLVGYAGRAYTPGDFTWMNGQRYMDEAQGASVLAHEIGHNCAHEGAHAGLARAHRTPHTPPSLRWSQTCGYLDKRRAHRLRRLYRYEAWRIHSFSTSCLAHAHQ